MAIFLVDLEFREKAKNLLTSKELAACFLLLLFALVPWVQIYDYARSLGNSTWLMEMEDGSPASHCNPHSRACI